MKTFAEVRDLASDAIFPGTCFGEDEVPRGTFHGEDEVPPGTFQIG